MEAIASYCLTEPGAGSDASALSTRAVKRRRRLCARRRQAVHLRRGSLRRLRGDGPHRRRRKPGPRGISAFIVEKGTPGLSFGALEEKMGWHAQPTAQVILEGVRVPADAMLGGADGEGAGFGIAMNGLNGGRLNIAACSLGGAQSAFDKAGAYVRERRGLRRLPCSTSPPSGSPWPTWRPGSRRRECCCGGRRLRSTTTTPTRSSCARWPNATSPTPASTSRTRRCSCTAATATCASTVWRRSSAICGCIESWKAPTKSCGWSSVAPRPHGSRHERV